MTKIKHTPSPWHVGKDFDAGLEKGFFVAGGGKILASMGGTNQKNDAYLIAAAPELLEALKNMLPENNVHGEKLSPPFERCEVARAVIAKAEGRQ